LEGSGEKSDVHVVVRSDDAPELVVAGSLDEAMRKLKTQIAELGAKSPRSEQDARRLKALERAIAELARVSDQLKHLNLSDVKSSAKPGERRVITLRQLDDLKKRSSSDAVGSALTVQRKEITPEKKAEIEKIRLKVKELTHELAVKRKELAEAQGDLA